MTAHKCEGPGYHPEAHADHTNQRAQFTGQPAGLQAAELAQFERLRDLLEQRGIILLANAHGGYIARRGTLTRVLNSLDAVERIARLLGATL